MTDDWHGLYGEGWHNEIVPDAFAHPAKFSRALIRHIYDHAIVEGWLQTGDTVIDPFGGVALGALDAMRLGINWLGIELEERFVGLGNQNIELWNSRYGDKLPKWANGVLLQGDSRELSQVISRASAAISSPPYSDTHNQGGDQATHPGMKWINGERTDRGKINRNNFKGVDYKLDGAISSPPYSSDGLGHHGDTGNEIDIKKHLYGRLGDNQYGQSPGNLGNLPSTEAGLAGAISSPPYAESLQTGNDAPRESDRQHRINIGRNPDSPGSFNLHDYGATEGQLGAMKANGFDSAVSSPPYSETRIGQESGQEQCGRGDQYGASPGNLGGSTDNDFWLAARAIVDQVYSVLRPGGHAIWVVKAFVKNKQRVDFPGQWQKLCEAVGFQTVHIHRAWLIEDKGTQIDLFGNNHTKTIERKSFFRRLAEQKGSPTIDYEIVLCMEKT